MDEKKGEDVLSFMLTSDNHETGNVEIEIASSTPVKMNDKELTLICGEKEELTKETDLLIRVEEETEEEVNGEENANAEVTIIEEMKEKVEDKKEIKPSSNEAIMHIGGEEEEEHKEEVNGKENANKEVNDEKNVSEEGMNVEDMKRMVNNEKQRKTVLKKKANNSMGRRKKGKVKIEKNANEDETELVEIQKRVIASSNGLNVLTGSDERECSKEKVNNQEIATEETKKDDGKNGNQMKASSEGKIDKSKKKGKRGRKKMAVKGINEVIAKDTNVQETSEKNTTKKDEVAGMIFMCSSKTKKDCYHYKILGLPAGKRDIVLKICDGMKLFLFDFDLKLLYGIYEAAGPGGYNIEPKAFKSAFPSQVRFNVYEDCLPLPEEKFRKVIKDNYYQKNKFDFQLTSEQVKNLGKVFRASSRDQKSKPSHGSSRTVTHAFANQDRTSKRHFGAETRISTDLDRTRKRRREQESPFSRERQYERKAYAAPAAPLRLHPLLPPPSSPRLPLYVYEGALGMNVYRRDPNLEHQDRRFLDLELRRKEQIEHRRDSIHEHRDARYLEMELRRTKDVEHHDRYVLYRDRPQHRDTSYLAAQPSDYPFAGPSICPTVPPPDYWHQPVYRY